MRTCKPRLAAHIVASRIGADLPLPGVVHGRLLPFVVFLRVFATCQWQCVNVGVSMRWRGRLAPMATYSEVPFFSSGNGAVLLPLSPSASCDLGVPNVLGGTSGGLPTLAAILVVSCHATSIPIIGCVLAVSVCVCCSLGHAPPCVSGLFRWPLLSPGIVCGQRFLWA